RRATWIPPPFNRVTDDSGGAEQRDPPIAVEALGTIYIVWTDFRNANTSPDIYATGSTNAGASVVANVKVNDDAGAAFQWVPSLAANGGKVEAVWADP